MNLDRMKVLSGQTATKGDEVQMREDLKTISEQYESALEAIKNGRQIDEGFFTSLKAAFQTASKYGGDGVQAVKQKAKKVSADVAMTYKDNKSKAELKELMISVKKLIDQMDKIAASAPTILKKDKKLAKEMEYFKRVMQAMIITMTSRKSLQENLTDEEINEILTSKPVEEDIPPTE